MTVSHFFRTGLKVSEHDLADYLRGLVAQVEPLTQRKGIELKLVSMDELAKLILAKEFVLQMHVGALLLAGMHGYIDLAAFRPAMRI